MNYYIASCSCGKDSLAMVLRLIKEKKPLDEIVFYDTDMEFKCIYDNWLLLKCYAGRHGIKCTRLEPKCSFLYTMFEKPVNVGKPNEHKGYSWCGGCCRWGTTAKLKALDEYCQAKNAKCYVGIAADETERLIKERKPYKLFPLAEWKMTERECLDYCRDKGISWKENSIDLYDILDRVSCWCCANKNLWELYNIWKYLPKYWERLKELQAKTHRPFKKDCSIFDLEQRFINGYIPKHRKRKNG
ncbi:phosphoadenosine phosphosulfate reductase [Anaerocaecibacter muris]|uniref:phosphoadenosine phosphosulfate reductase n=1 Tax=Anaerocaecibacter muris TaxID=2941513 RepID=UPI00203BC436|nr:phosphoadenosine phosphosulfate reductase [Anaerocaecibacter muris]MCX4312835.1 phosphoadenosine phosphosulfate reductase [Clostridia bacterium]